jgi:hypothetical protein
MQIEKIDELFLKIVLLADNFKQMNNRIILSLLMIILFAATSIAQDAGVDTTDVRYQVGYKIGTYLPVTIILILAIFFIRKAFRFKE